jgi:hypothetical protein
MKELEMSIETKEGERHIHKYIHRHRQKDRGKEC